MEYRQLQMTLFMAGGVMVLAAIVGFFADDIPAGPAQADSRIVQSEDEPAVTQNASVGLAKWNAAPEPVGPTAKMIETPQQNDLPPQLRGDPNEPFVAAPSKSRATAQLAEDVATAAASMPQ